MKAAVLHRGEVLVRDGLPDPVPGLGQALVEVRACGICGSDLHFAKHGAAMLALGRQMEGMPDPGGEREELDLDRDVYWGHEFAGEVVEFGPGTESAIRPGALVTALPVLLRPDGTVDPIVYSNSVMGGYGERMLLTAPLLLEVPNGLPAHLAAMTEPMAVGTHGVNRSGIETGQGALVLGCGPIGLALVAALARRGIEPIIAADFSPARRALAETMGAHVAVDPRQESGWAAWQRLAEGRTLQVYEAIGIPGILDDIMRLAPHGSKVTVVGVCMEPDTINPYFGIAKELDIRFALAYDPMEFADTLRAIAEGELNVAPLVTARVPLDQAAWAFDALGDPEEHCKIIIEPTG
jgi:threonine dehydrogenase-like Zn-dependent dehydrogenase